MQDINSKTIERLRTFTEDLENDNLSKYRSRKVHRWIKPSEALPEEGQKIDFDFVRHESKYKSRGHYDHDWFRFERGGEFVHGTHSIHHSFVVQWRPTVFGWE